MIDKLASLAGSFSSPRPQRGPEASHRMSLAIFIKAAAAPLRAAEARTIASSDPCATNLLGAVTKGLPVSLAILAATFLEKPFGAFNPLPTAAPSIASS